MIEQPTDIIWHIMGEEVGMAQGLPTDFIDTDKRAKAKVDHQGWKMAFTQNKTINSKKLIEGIAKESKLFPFVKGNVLSFNSIQDTYTEADYEAGYIYDIHDKDVISSSFSRTKPEDVRTAVYVHYDFDYATEEYKKSTKSDPFADTAKDLLALGVDGVEYSNSYNGIPDDEEQGDDPVEANYIRNDNTAHLLQRFLLLWYCNQHNLAKLRLPLSYIKAEVGDIVTFPNLIKGRKAYGEDYSYDYRKTVAPTFRNGQEILPFWMITSTSKTLEYVDIELIQLHSLANNVTDYAPTAKMSVSPSTQVLEGTEVEITASAIDPETEGDVIFTPTFTHSGLDVSFPEEHILKFVAPQVDDTTFYEIGLTVTVDEVESLPISQSIKVTNTEEEIIQQTIVFSGSAGGWYFIGINVDGIENDAPADVFAELIANNDLEVITGFDGGYLIYDPTLMPFLNTLQKIQAGSGYQVKVHNDATLTIPGASLIDNSFTYNLNEGWNMIAYSGTEPMPPQDAFIELINDIDDNGEMNLWVVTAFDNGYDIYDPTFLPFLNTLQLMERGFGYWVKVRHAVENFTFPE